jgi:membrane associated rhomboid family serine protease
MKITFNAPVILGFTIAATVVMGLTVTIFPNLNGNYFASTGFFDWGRIADYFRLFSHILGHENWPHLIGNFSIILLIGPILEEKYGSKKLLIMILATALMTGIFNNVFWDYGLMGASGIVFMMILLGSLVNFASGTIPITFILITALYLGQEIYDALSKDDHVSQFAHIMGGVCGMFFGFAMGKGGIGSKIPGLK